MKNESNSPNTYSTGSTQPRKNHNGLICTLLAAVIFLCGVATALGVSNQRLFQALQAQNQDEGIALARSHTDATRGEEGEYYAPLGFSGETLSPFWQQYLELPQGIYITQVDAAVKDFFAGDLLVGFGSHPITDCGRLRELMEDALLGQTVELTVLREGKLLQVQVLLEEE